MDCGPDGKAHRRLNTIHLLLVGATYEVALRNSRVSERTFRLWISRFNELGIDGLIYRPGCGRRRKLEPHVVSELILPLVDDPSLAGQTHWTLTKLCGYLREEKQLDLTYRTLNRYLHEHRYARKIPRRMPEPPDREAWESQREGFANELLDLLADPSCEVVQRQLRIPLATIRTEVFFGDEAGFEGDPRPRQKWVKRGTRPVQGYHGGHSTPSSTPDSNSAPGSTATTTTVHTSHSDTSHLTNTTNNDASKQPE